MSDITLYLCYEYSCAFGILQLIYKYIYFTNTPRRYNSIVITVHVVVDTLIIVPYFMYH